MADEIRPDETQHDAIRHKPKVITVTLNPSLDRTLTTHFLSQGYHNRVTEATRLDPAGRGVSISRALHTLGVPTHAIILVGGDPTGRAYQSLIAEEQFPMTILRRTGVTRSNIHLYDTGHNTHTVLMDDSRGVTRMDRQEVANALIRLIEPGDTVVFAGSLPGDVRTDTYAVLTSLAQTLGAAVAINAGGGDPLEASIQARPTLVYLSQMQLEGLFNIPVRAYEDVIGCAHRLQARGVRRVLVAMENRDSAFLITETGTWWCDWPDVSATTAGRNEALIAGYLAGRLTGHSFEEALQLGALMAAYTVAQVGVEFGTLRDVKAHMSEITVTPADVIAELVEAQQQAQDS
ncbi:MAG: hypothetical protein JXQ72_00065 [Anaerolineae bacterium]|nr:hypothetical protein [Anaerolineae bacterium]